MYAPLLSIHAGVHTLQSTKLCISLTCLEGRPREASTSTRCWDDTRLLLTQQKELSLLPKVYWARLYFSKSMPVLIVPCWAFAWMKMKKAINSLYCAYCLALQLFLQHLFLREFTTAQARLGRSLADVNKWVTVLTVVFWLAWNWLNAILFARVHSKHHLPLAT